MHCARFHGFLFLFRNHIDAALSTAIGPRIKLITRVAPLPLNLFFLHVGPSGLAKKTIALQRYFYETLLQLENSTMQDFLLYSTFTVEGLHDYFLTKTQKSGCIVQDEISRLFKDVRNKKYMGDMLEYLSCLYDGQSPSRLTIKHGGQDAVQVFVTLVRPILTLSSFTLSWTCSYCPIPIVLPIPAIIMESPSLVLS